MAGSPCGIVRATLYRKHAVDSEEGWVLLGWKPAPPRLRPEEGNRRGPGYFCNRILGKILILWTPFAPTPWSRLPNRKLVADRRFELYISRESHSFSVFRLDSTLIGHFKQKVRSEQASTIGNGF